MKRTKSGGGVVIGPNDLVLVVSQHGTSWSLPKGHIDPGEDAKMAAERETKEEAGVTSLKYIKDLGSYRRYQIAVDGGENKDELKTIYMFLYTTGQLELSPEDEHNPEARWVEPENVSNLLTHPKDKAFFEGILDEVTTFIENR